ncbi:uncharacterized protein PF3D7_1120000-like [Onthophagus taurus]|uniref:uncharacterized protein PF3D7_1120000-like n=1 Tax=Onthophagus taurus TaxID=166361 RepID=UPI000C1FEC0E|nr:uncharacterized protein LOC111422082 [Onthophagus taurus]
MKIFAFLVFAAIFINLALSECESCKKSSKKEKNIYSKEANEGDFKHDDAKKLNQEDEIINEEEIGENSDEKKDVEVEQKKIDPKKAKEVLAAIKQLGGQLNDMFSKSFKTLHDAVPEIQGVIQNMTDEAIKVVKKTSIESGKNLDIVSKTIKNVMKEAKAEVGEYKKFLTEKQKLTEIPESSLEIKSDDSNEVVKKITEEIERMMGGGNIISDIMNDIPDKIGVILGKANKKLKEKLIKHEKDLNVDLTDVKVYCDNQISEITTSLSSSLKQTGGLLSMTMNTILTLVSTLKSQIK